MKNQDHEIQLLNEEIIQLTEQRDQAIEQAKVDRKFYSDAADEVLRLTFKNRSLEQERDALRDRLQTIASLYYRNKEREKNFKKMETYYIENFEETLDRALK